MHYPRQDTGLPDSAGDPGNPSLLHGPVDDKCALAQLGLPTHTKASCGLKMCTRFFLQMHETPQPSFFRSSFCWF